MRELHRAGIEVILDVVYNHTAEGSELGPTLSLRGIDNATYYALTGPPDEPGRYYMNWAGCGNILELDRSPVIRFVMDSLRYWATEFHVDGFRFDLASVLGRTHGVFQQASAFFDVVSQDPVLSRVKLSPSRGTSRRTRSATSRSTGRSGTASSATRSASSRRATPARSRELASRLSGSSDLYGGDGRLPYNTVNFVTCHDGFTLHDLVAYNGKHNEANLEDNRDGCDDNNSWNSGAEGHTDDAEVTALRRQRAQQLDAAAAVRGRHADAARRRRAAAHAARQQQRVLPRQRAVVARLDARTTRTRTSSRSCRRRSGS